MVREPIDAEKIGAVLDGMAGQERDELLVRLAADEDDYEVFADTAAVLREIEEEEASAPAVAIPAAESPAAETPRATLATESPATEIPRATLADETPAAEWPRGETPALEVATSGATPVERAAEAAVDPSVIPLRPSRANVWAKPGVRWLAAAAVLATVAVPLYQSRANGAWRDPQRLASLAMAEESLPADVNATRPWPTTRGGERPGEPLRGSSAKVGTLHADLEVAVNARGARDTATVAELARSAAAVAQAIDQTGADFVEGQYKLVMTSAAAPRAELLANLKTAGRDASQYLDADYFALGAWTEAARLAAGRRNAAFFSSKQARRALEQAESLEGLSDDAKTAAQAAASLVEQEGGIRDWSALSDHLLRLHQALVRTPDSDPFTTD
jgi:hypothetical protein